MFSTKTIQFDECRRGAMTLDFMKSGVIAPSLHPPKLKSFCWNIWFYKVFGWILPEIHQISPDEICQISWNPPDFTWNLPDFMNVSFCVMIKYRSFFRKTNQITQQKLFSFMQCSGKAMSLDSHEICWISKDQLPGMVTPMFSSFNSPPTVVIVFKMSPCCLFFFFFCVMISS